MSFKVCNLCSKQPYFNRAYVVRGRVFFEVSVFATACQLYDKLIVYSIFSDDTDALNAVVAVYDVLLFSFGLDEDELNDHMEEHRTIKLHR